MPSFEIKNTNQPSGRAFTSCGKTTTAIARQPTSASRM